MSDQEEYYTTSVASSKRIEAKLDIALEKLDSLQRQLSQTETLARETRQLVGPFGLSYPDGTLLVQTLHGNKYFIDPLDMVMAPQLVIYRQWEPDLSRLFLSLATPDTVFVDVGANFGYFTCLVGSRIGTSGRGAVYAVEPNPQMFQLLTRNIGVNWSMAPITTFQCGASDVARMANLYVPRTNAANASLAAPPATPDIEAVEIIVETKPLDAMVPRDQSVDLLKIDVEGFELLVLRGAGNIIRRSPDITIVMEWSLAQMERAGFAPQDFFTFCAAHGLEIFDVPSSCAAIDWNQLRLTPEELACMGYGNVILRHVGQEG